MICAGCWSSVWGCDSIDNLIRARLMTLGRGRILSMKPTSSGWQCGSGNLDQSSRSCAPECPEI